MCRRQALESEVFLHVVACSPADDAPGVEVHHDCQIEPSLVRPDVADIHASFLIRAVAAEILIENIRRNGATVHGAPSSKPDPSPQFCPCTAHGIDAVIWGMRHSTRLSPISGTGRRWTRKRCRYRRVPHISLNNPVVLLSITAGSGWGCLATRIAPDKVAGGSVETAWATGNACECQDGSYLQIGDRPARLPP